MRALVTGAGRGIGAALRDERRARGHEVLGTHRGTASEGWLSLEVTDPAAQEAAGETTGPLDLLVCNAGVLRDKGKTFQDTSAEDWAETLAVNVTGVALTIQAQLRNLREGARIAILSSIMGQQSRTPGRTLAYRASKAAVTNLGLNLAEMLRPEGIAVGIYHPGWVRTDMGGPSADVAPEASAQGLWDQFEALTLKQSGQFKNYDGATLAL